tara:strand:+ start:715 stop:984 length:270 start_codon:yes stop_codon:yes gene_type:complete
MAENKKAITPPEPPKEQISLTLQDLNTTANIIDLAVQRGAFKGAEVATVGNAFNKLVEIIQKISPPAPAEEQKAEDTPAETQEETATKE